MNASPNRQSAADLVVSLALGRCGWQFVVMGIPASLSRALTTTITAIALTTGHAWSQAPSRATPPAPGAAGDVLTGWVVDVVGRPMADVEVYIAGTDRRTRSDTRGLWRIPNPPGGPRVVVARELGYVPYIREVVVGSANTDTMSLLLRRFPRTLSPVEIRAKTDAAISSANIVAERLMQMRVGSGRMFTRDQILQMRPYSVAELIFGVPGVSVVRGSGESQGSIIATTTRSGVGASRVDGQPCMMQFYYDNTLIDNESLGALDPMTFRSVEVYPQTVLLTGLPTRTDRCGAVVINSVNATRR